jgi:HK97 gp10 family phage protein
MTIGFKRDVRVTGDFREKIAEFAKFVGKDLTAVGAQAMAEEVYVEARALAPESHIPTHYFYGEASQKAPKGQKREKAYKMHTGDLKKAIYQVYSQKESSDHRSTYHVSWNSGKKGKGANVSVGYGHMVEFGTKYAAAKPFLYPAFERTKGRLLEVAGDAMREKLASR